MPRRCLIILHGTQARAKKRFRGEIMTTYEAGSFGDMINEMNRTARDEVLEFYNEVTDKDLFDDCGMLMERLRSNLVIRPFGELLRLYLYRTGTLGKLWDSFDKVPDGRYHRELCARFDANGMGGTASLDPEKPHALDHRFVYRLFRKERVGRDVVFLLAFGLGMDDRDCSVFLTQVIRESNFNFKDPREAIYYYCLKNALGYAGMLRFLDIYEKLPPRESRFTAESHTYEYEQCFRAAAGEEEFVELLGDVKAAQRRFGRSRRDVFMNLLNMYKTQVFFTSDEYMNTLVGRLSALPALKDAMDISLYQVEKSIYYPDTRDKTGNMLSNYHSSLCEKSWFLRTKLTRQRLAGMVNGTMEITRSDIITLVFLNENLWDTAANDPQQILDDFIAVADDFLASARFAPFCIDDPYESFIALCLCSEFPQDSYRMVWSRSYREGE